MSQLGPQGSVTSITRPARPRRRMSASDRRQVILGAALSAFAEGGYHETSLEDVARRAGVSKALIYEHFASKRELHGALLETYVHELLGRVMSAAGSADAGEARLRAGLEGFLNFVEQRRDAWRLLVRNAADGELAGYFERLRREVAGAIAAQMGADAPPGSPLQGVGRERAIEALAEQQVGAVQSLANWWDENRDVPSERVVEIAMDFMWIGLDRLGAGESWAPS